VLANDLNGAVQQGERVAVLGPAGIIKTTLFRAIGGIWPFGSGQIELPAHAQPLFLTHRPYLPLGTLRDAVCTRRAGTLHGRAYRRRAAPPAARRVVPADRSQP
jgi:putative ATP-binding cassette transporter